MPNLKRIVRTVIFFSGLLILAVEPVYCQQGFNNATRALYIFDLARYIDFGPGFEDSATFKIGAMAGDYDLIYEMGNLARTRTRIQEKPVLVAGFRNIESLTYLQVLYVNKKDGFDLDKIKSAIRGMHTMLITEGYEFRESMINFIVVEGKPRFDINEEYIKQEGMSVPQSLLFTAIKTKEDWQNLFNIASKELETQKVIIRQQVDTIDSQKKEIMRQKTLLDSLDGAIEIKEKTLVEKQKVLGKQFEMISSQQGEISVQKKTIISQQKEVEVQRDTLTARRKKIAIQLDSIDEQLQKISDQGNIQIIIAADCTGHGVPGAFMSMLGVAMLNELVNGKHIIMPDQIIDNLRQGIIKSLKQVPGNESVKDGMDMAVCVVDLEKDILWYSGANCPLYMVRGKELIHYRADKMPAAIHYRMEPFRLHKINLLKGDTFYIFSDGFADQFGGPNQKKFMTNQLKETLVSMAEEPMLAQGEKLNRLFEDWRGQNPQVDDVIIIGVRY